MCVGGQRAVGDAVNEYESFLHDSENTDAGIREGIDMLSQWLEADGRTATEEEKLEKEFELDCDEYDNILSKAFFDNDGRRLELMQHGRIGKNKQGEMYFRNQIDDYRYRAVKHKSLNVYTYFTTLHKTNRIQHVDESAKFCVPHPLRNSGTMQINVRDLIGVIIGPTWPNKDKDACTYELHARMTLILFKPWGNFDGQRKLKEDTETWATAYDKFIRDESTDPFILQYVKNTQFFSIGKENKRRDIENRRQIRKEQRLCLDMDAHYRRHDMS